MLPQPGELLRVGPRDPGWRGAQAVPFWILAYREQDLPDGALDARQVELPVMADRTLSRVLRHSVPLVWP
jgi:hypothetical protein